MLQILASLLILLNPAAAFFTSNQEPAQNISPLVEKEWTNIDFEEYKLPLSENIFLAAQLIPTYPIRNWNSSDPEISAKIGFIFETTRQKVLWQKDGLREARPIASLTKLMTALVVMENTKLDDVFVVSKKAVQTPGELGGLIVGEELSVEKLLYALLVESSNDAAVSLAENIVTSTKQDFVSLMNKKASSLALSNTTFTDPSGLDPGNRSSAWDLNILMQEFLKYPILQKISQTASIDFNSEDGRFTHHLISTDKLLGLYPEIIAGKTGYTEEAGNCMIMAWRAPNNQGTVISIIMDSQNRMLETEMLLKWTKEAYLW